MLKKGMEVHHTRLKAKQVSFNFFFLIIHQSTFSSAIWPIGS